MDPTPPSLPATHRAARPVLKAQRAVAVEPVLAPCADPWTAILIITACGRRILRLVHQTDGARAIEQPGHPELHHRPWRGRVVGAEARTQQRIDDAIDPAGKALRDAEKEPRRVHQYRPAEHDGRNVLNGVANRHGAATDTTGRCAHMPLGVAAALIRADGGCEAFGGGSGGWVDWV
jgi:hypothetical protein